MIEMDESLVKREEKYDSGQNMEMPSSNFFVRQLILYVVDQKFVMFHVFRLHCWIYHGPRYSSSFTWVFILLVILYYSTNTKAAKAVLFNRWSANDGWSSYLILTGIIAATSICGYSGLVFGFLPIR